uniref:Uncharacterized protein n=1 Tax=Leptobrachium leishanense TaxID=445787 RepID=A0A8C5N3U7_9ANUR
MLSMAQRNGTSKTPAFILLLAILVMALLELSAASTGSTSINNLHTQSHTEDLDNEEEEEEEDEEEEVKIKQTVESKPSVSKSSLGETSEYFVRKRQQVQERSESKVQVPSILKHPNKKVSDLDNSQTFDNKEASETTTTAPKTSAPALRRRIRPFSNPLHSRTKMTGQNPSSVVTQDNETKTPDVKDSGSHATFEGIGTSTNIDDDSNVKIKNEEHSNEQSVPSKHPTEGRSHTEKGDSKPDLVGRKSSLASPVSIPVGKGTTSTNQRSAVSKLPTGQGNARLPSKPMRPNSPNQKNGSSQQHPTVLEEEQTLHENIKTKHSHETLKIKPESTVITSRKINPNIKKQSHSPLLLSQSKESTSSAPHDSRHFDIETREEKQSGSKDNRFFDQSDKRPHSARHPEKSIQAKKNDDKQSRHYDHALVKSKAQTEIEKKTKKTTLSGYKTIMTTAMTTLRTEPTTMSTTTVTATTESPTTYKSNRREINEYKPKETDVKSTSPIQKPAVNSNPKKSALSLLEYYRRRSSEVKNNVGTKVKANSISVAPTMVSVYATTTMLATTTTTTKHLEYSKQDKTVKTNVGSAGSTARMTPAPYKPLSKHKASRHPQDKSIPISSKPRISKTLDGKSLTSVVKSKPEDVYDIPKEKQDVSAKIEQAKPITLSRIPAKANQEHPKKATAVQDVKQTAHDEETVLHNMKSTTTSSNATKFTKHSSAPSSSLTQSSKVDSTVLQKAISAQDKNTKVDSEAGNKPSRSSSLHTEGNKNIGFRRTPISKPSSETVDHLHHGASATSKPKLSTADILKVPAKPQQFAKVQDPTPPSKAKQPYSNDGGLKHRNINGDAFEKNLKENVFSQEQSEKLKDEEGLTVPLTIKESTQKPPGFRTSYRNNKYAILTRKLNTAGTKAPATTNHPQTTRPNQYRLLPTVARKINFGSSSSIVRTTHLPTTTPVRTPSPTYSPRPRILNSRFGYQGRRPFGRPFLRQGANGRQIPTTRNNGNVSSSRNGNLNGQRIIFGPQGTKWVVDLNRGLVLNPEGRYLQDSTGKPLRIKLGGDGRTIIDMQGTPVVSPDGLPLFGHGRFSKPVASPQDKPVLSLGGRPLRGLEVARTTRIPTTRMTTTLFTTRPTTTTPIPTTTTTPEPTTELATIEPTTEEPFLPTCPPGSYTQYDEEGNLIMGHDNKPDCYEEDSYSGEDLIVTTKTPYLDLDQDYDLFATTLAPIKTTEQLPLPDTNSFNTNLVSEYDVAGKKRFTAPYVSYINKDPNTPCSLTDALEHFQVENLEDIIPKDLKGEFYLHRKYLTISLL